MVVEYGPVSVDTFIEIADAVEEAFPQLMVEGTEVPDKGAAITVCCDDVVLGGEGGPAPSADAVLDALRTNFRGSLQDVHLE